jgi:hypothetical protein
LPVTSYGNDYRRARLHFEGQYNHVGRMSVGPIYRFGRFEYRRDLFNQSLRQPVIKEDLADSLGFYHQTQILKAQAN